MLRRKVCERFLIYKKEPHLEVIFCFCCFVVYYIHIMQRYTQQAQYTSSKQRGFTLIELLVVISIIGLLTTLAAVAIQNARLKAQDVAILHDVEALAKALDLYYDDNGEYSPSRIGFNFSDAFCDIQIRGDATEAVFRMAMSPYMAKIPNPLPLIYNNGWFKTTSRILYQPVDGSCNDGAATSNDDYKLVFYLETTTDLGPGGYYARFSDGRVGTLTSLCGGELWNSGLATGCW